jgi:hypothetical protein
VTPVAARVAIAKSNFTAGELKPQLHGREDLTAFQNGAKAIENRVPMPEGGLIRRPGAKFVMALPDQTHPGKLIPFKFSRNDARVLVLSAGVATVCYSGGGIVQNAGADYTFAIPWSPAQYGSIRWIESANQIFVADGSAPKTIQRTGTSPEAWSWGWYAHNNGPTLVQNTDISKTIVASGTSGSVTLTANFDAFQPGHVGSIWRLDEGDLGSIPYWTADELITVTASTTTPSTYRRNAGAVYAASSSGPASGSAGVNPPTQTFGTSKSAADTVVWTFKYMAYGYVKITGYTDARHVTATVLGVGGTQQTVLPDSVAAIPTYRWSEAAWSDVRGWPNLVSYCQQRMAWFVSYKCFLTYSGDNFSFLVDTTDSSAITAPILSIDGSVLLPQWTYSSGWIVVGCADSEPVLRGPNMFDALTQTNMLAVVDKGQGSAWHIPAIVDAAVANIGVSRRRLHYAKINRLIDTLNVDEISVNSQHILAGLAAGVAYQHDPYRVIWGYSLNGDLWSYTFRPDQQVIAAARHPMPNGYVEDICAIPSADGTAVELWMIVRRVLQGQTLRIVEVLQPFFEAANPPRADATGAWFVDCGLAYAGAATATLAGLPFPDGTIVRVVSAGAWLGDFAAAGGAVTLPRAVTSAIAGLPIVARLRTLPLDPARPGSTTKSDMKRATHGFVDFLEAAGPALATLYAQDDEGNWNTSGYAEAVFPSGFAPAAPAAMPLFTGRKSFPLDGPHGRRIELELVDDHPCPSTVLALAPDVEDAEA